MFLTRILIRRLNRKWRQLSEILYPDTEDRVYALLAEAAELYEIVAMSKGLVVENIVVTLHEEAGYNIEINHVGDYVEEG